MTEPSTSVLWHVTMSLDGFIAGPGDALDWVFDYTGPNAAVDDVIRTTGSVLAGRRSYDVGRRDGRGAYGGAWKGPQFVLTHKIPDAPEDPTITFLSDDVSRAVALARAAADGKNVTLIGASIARQCLDAGLVDEILVHLAPVLLGAGVRFFDHPGIARVRLERISVAQSGQLTDLRFRVVKQRRAPVNAERRTS
jgi:dihydrofolate reductase